MLISFHEHNIFIFSLFELSGVPLSFRSLHLSGPETRRLWPSQELSLQPKCAGLMVASMRELLHLSEFVGHGLNGSRSHHSHQALPALAVQAISGARLAFVAHA